MKNMDIRGTRTCEQCSTAIPLANVRLVSKNQDRTSLLCPQCAGKFKERVLLAQGKSKIEALPPAEYVGYKCTRCNYSFRVDAIKAGLTHRLLCPYCGKSERLVQLKKK